MSIVSSLLDLIIRNGPTFDASTPTLAIDWPSFAYLPNIFPALDK